MITWLQTRFQKGYQLIFLLVLAIVIVAFVFTIGAGPSSGPGARDLEATDFFGYRLGTAQGRENFQRDGFWSHLLRHGQEPRSIETFLLRATYLGLANELGLAPPNDEEIIRFVRSRAFFQGPDGRFDSRSYQEFLEELHNFRITEAEIFRILAEDFMAEKAERLMTGPGFLSATEVERQMAAMHIAWSIQTASFPLDRITYDHELTEEDLIEFHAANTGRYQSTPQRVIAYFRLSPDRFRDAVRTPSENDLRRHFEAHPDRFPAPNGESNEEEMEETETEESDETSAGTDIFALVKDAVRDDLIQQRARAELRSYVTRLTRELWEVRELTGQMETILVREGISLTTLPPVDEGRLPEGQNWPRAVRDIITGLNLENRPFSDPVAVGDDFLMIFLQELIPASPLPFAEVRTEVEEDLRAERRREKRASLTLEWRDSLRAAISGEESSFASVAEDLELDLANYEAFTRMDPPEGLPWQIFNALDDLRPGDVSSLINAGDKGVFIFVESRELPEDPTALEGFSDRRSMVMNFVKNQLRQSTGFEYIERTKPFVLEENLF